MATCEEILEILEVLAEVYGGDPKPRGYYIALADLDLNMLKAGAETVIRTLDWFPKPSQLRRACLEFHETTAGSTDLLAYEVNEMDYAVHHNQPEAYDPERLEQIAAIYEGYNRLCTAEYVRDRSRRMACALQDTETAEQRRVRYQLPAGYIAQRDEAVRQRESGAKP